MKNIKKVLYIMTALTVMSTPLYAAETGAKSKPVSPPKATHMEYVTENIPIRVWVLPGTIEGVSYDGHYEYFSMPMLSSEPKQVMTGLPQDPVIKAIPQQDVTKPAISH